MSRMSNIHLARQEYADQLTEKLGLPVTIIENDDPNIWIYETPDGRTVTRTHFPGHIETITTHKKKTKE